MSVDTKIEGRNLAPYRRLADGDAVVLITPELTRMARELHVDAGGLLGRKFRIEFVDPYTGSGSCSR